MHLAAPVQLLLLAFCTTASMASPLAAPSANEAEVAARTTHSTVDKRSYTSTCRSCYLTWFQLATPSLVLVYKCRRAGGEMGPASLYLNDCIANRNGNMAWAHGFVPHFNLVPDSLIANPLYSFSENSARSCTAIRLEGSNVLATTCPTAGGGTKNSRLTLCECFTFHLGPSFRVPSEKISNRRHQANIHNDNGQLVCRF